MERWVLILIGSFLALDVLLIAGATLWTILRERTGSDRARRGR